MMAVSVSGSVLSSLCFEHSNSKGDQEGLLLGQVVSHITDTISDSQLNNVKEEIITYVYNYISCDGLFSWYDSAGKINMDKLKGLLKNKKHKEVVGWYKFRRNSTMRVSLRERMVHTNLYQLFPGVASQQFLYCLFTSSTTSNLSTHSFDHTFHIFNGRQFIARPLTVVNLKDTSHGEYMHHSNSTVNPNKGIYNQAIARFTPEFLGEGGNLHQVITSRTLHSHLHTQLLSMCGAVAETEEKVGRLVEDIETLRQRLHLKQQPKLKSQTDIDIVQTSVPNEVETLRVENNHVPSSSAFPTKVISRDKVKPADYTQPPGDITNQTGPKIHEDLQHLILDGQLDGAPTTSQEHSKESEKMELENKNANLVTVPCLTPELVNQEIEKPTTLSLSDKEETDIAQDKNQDKSETEKTEKKKGDAFDFVTDLLSKAKSPTSESPPKQIGSSSPILSHNKEKKGPKVVKPTASVSSPKLSTSRSARQTKSKSVLVDNSPAKCKQGPATKDDMAVNHDPTSRQTVPSGAGKPIVDSKIPTSQARATRSSLKSTAGRPRPTSRSGSGPRSQEKSGSSPGLGQRSGSSHRTSSGQRSGTSPKPLTEKKMSNT